MLAAVFNHKVNENLIAVFQDALKGYPGGVLQSAFIKAERQLERFPTPKVMRSLCNEDMPSRAWRYDFAVGSGIDPESGREVQILIDPDPTCAVCREPQSAHPVKLATGLNCQYFKPSSLGDSREMFRPQDCPEGRAFLTELKRIALAKK
jgi:hypothetical protein